MRWLEGGLVFRAPCPAYLDGDLEQFESRTKTISDLEHKADDLIKAVRCMYHCHSLIPEHRAMCWDCSETTDTIIDTAKTGLFQFSVERPVIPAQYALGFARLVDASNEAMQALKSYRRPHLLPRPRGHRGPPVQGGPLRARGRRHQRCP
ncbi:MAG: DUF47 family protein [bacterium]|nr:DUF47 family protein [bacterium]